MERTMTVLRCMAGLVMVMVLEGVSGITIEEDQWNYAGAVNMFGKNDGIIFTGKHSGASCLASAGSIGGEYSAVLTEESKICTFQGTTFLACYDTPEPVTSPLFSKNSGAIVFSSANDAFELEPATGSITAQGFLLTGDAYVTCFGTGCFVPLDSCSGFSATGYTCVEAPGALGGVLAGFHNSKVLLLIRTATALTTSDGVSLSLSEFSGFKKAVYDNGGWYLHFEESVCFTDVDFSNVECQEGEYLYSAFASVKTGDVFTRMRGLVSSDSLEIIQDGVDESLKIQVTDPGFCVPLPSMQLVCFYGSQKAMGVYTAHFRSSDDQIIATYEDAQAILPEIPKTEVSPCVPRLFGEEATDGEYKLTLQVYTEDEIQWWSVCDVRTDAGCLELTRTTLGDDGTWTTIFIALVVSVLVVPASMYTYRLKKSCTAPQSKADEPQVRYDREKGVSYDPAYEQYVNQFTEDSKVKRGKVVKDDDE